MGVAALADRCTESFSIGTLEENQEYGSNGRNACCYDDDIHFDSAIEALSLICRKDAKNRSALSCVHLPVPHKQLDTLP